MKGKLTAKKNYVVSRCSCQQSQPSWIPIPFQIPEIVPIPFEQLPGLSNRIEAKHFPRVTSTL